MPEPRARWFSSCLGLAAIGFLVSASPAQDSAPTDFAALSSRLLRLDAAGDRDRVLDLLPRLGPFDTAEAARFVLEHLLGHEDLLIHQEAARFLASRRERAAQKIVLDAALEHRNWEMRASCVRILGAYPGEFTISKIEAALTDEKWQVRSSAIRALAAKRRKSVIPVLIERLLHEKGRVRQDLVWALRQLTALTFGDSHPDWKTWWDVYGADFRIPTLAKVEATLHGGGGSVTLKTAVQAGIYGPIYSENIAFLLDVSESMSAGTDLQGTRAEIAVRELVKVMDHQLSRSTHFNIIAFSKHVLLFRPQLSRATKQTRRKAQHFLERLPVGGETNVFGALKAAFEDPAVDTIYLLSDGTPTDGEETIPEIILHEVAKWNRDRRVIINCIGFFPGAAQNEDKISARTFLWDLARENEGFYKEIY